MVDLEGKGSEKIWEEGASWNDALSARYTAWMDELWDISNSNGRQKEADSHSTKEM